MIAEIVAESVAVVVWLATFTGFVVGVAMLVDAVLRRVKR